MRICIFLQSALANTRCLCVCAFQATGCLFNHIRWGDAFLVVYSVCERSSFQAARGFLETLSQEKLPGYFTTVLLGNKRDIEHARWVQRPIVLVAGMCLPS